MKRLQQHCFVLLFLLALPMIEADMGSCSLRTKLQRKAVRPIENDKRLPTNLVPTHYTVKLKPDFYGSCRENFFFEGWVTIHVRCLRATDVVVLHMNDLDLSNSVVSVKKENCEEELYSNHSCDCDSHFLRLYLKRKLTVLKSYTVTIFRFSGRLRSDGFGLFLSQYATDDNDTVYLVASTLKTMWARNVFPCFDEPQLKATFDVTLVRRTDTGRNYFSLSNAPLVSSKNIDSCAWIEDRFNTTPKMSTYHLVFIICDFLSMENNTSTEPPIKFRVFAQPADQECARWVHGVAIKAFKDVSQHFKPKYSSALNKMDIVLVPKNQYASLENWGLITYLPHRMVFLEKYTEIIYHAVLHQWFGGYVSPRSWKWLWLSESIACWFQYSLTGKAYPEWKNLQKPAILFHTVMRNDARVNSAIVLETESQIREEIESIAKSTMSTKGVAIVRMMELIMGNNIFVKSLNEYLLKYKYSNADSGNLFGVLDETLTGKRCKGKNLFSTRMPAWFSQPGLPMIVVNKTALGYRLTQRRFVTDSDKGTNQYMQNIPIAYEILGEGRKFDPCDDAFWLRKCHELDIETSSKSPIVINYDQMAYCRVLYDKESYNAVIHQLNKNHAVISPINRGMIIDDAWAFFENGQLELSVALRTSDYLKSESELSPWNSFTMRFSRKANLLRFTDLKEKIKNRMRLLFKKPFKELLIHTPIRNLPLEEMLVRQGVENTACRYDLSECVEKARTAFRDLKTDNLTGLLVPFNYREMQLCTVLANGNDDDWQYMLNRSTSDNSSLSFAAILSCSRKCVHLSKFLDMCLDGVWNETAGIDVCLYYVSQNPEGLDVALEFVLQHSDELQEKLSESIFGLKTSDFHSKAFLETKIPMLKAKYYNANWVMNLEKRAKWNHDWLNKHYDTIETWLTETTQLSQPTKSTKVNKQKRGKGEGKEWEEDSPISAE